MTLCFNKNYSIINSCVDVRDSRTDRGIKDEPLTLSFNWPHTMWSVVSCK